MCTFVSPLAHSRYCALPCCLSRMETAPVQLLTGNPTSLLDTLQQPASPSSSAASAQALNDLQHNVRQLKQQLASTADQIDMTALLQLTEPRGSLHEPTQQCQQQMALNDKHCQLVLEWELHKAAALQQHLEVQQLNEDNLACLSTAQHAHHAEQSTIEGWLYSQYEQRVAEAQDITRDQNRCQADNAVPKQLSQGLKLCTAENKGRLGVHELQLLCGEYHFQAQNERAKYEALRDRYILLQQAYRALEEKLERAAAATACQEGFEACHAVKNPVYSVPTVWTQRLRKLIETHCLVSGFYCTWHACLLPVPFVAHAAQEVQHTAFL